MRKRILSVLTAAAMLLTLLPAALAESMTGATEKEIGANVATDSAVGEKTADTAQVELTDVDETHPFWGEISLVYEGGLMEAAEGAFRPEDSLTLGQFTVSLYVMIGGPADAQEAITALNAHMILPADPADTLLTRDDAVKYLNNFLLALGLEREEHPLGEYADAQQLDQYMAPVWARMLANGLILPREGNTLAPNEPMTRGEFAFMLAHVATQIE